jgi:hypothetical protein
VLAGTNQHGDRDRDGDKQNNQSNDDKHVDASDLGARSPVHAIVEAVSTMLTYSITISVGEVTVVGMLMGTSSNFGNMFSAASASAVLTFLPMLPSQILLNNLRYDSFQLTIPTDRVDEERLAPVYSYADCVSQFPRCAPCGIVFHG